MCYWETYSGQGSFGDPAGCVTQAKADLAELSPGRTLEYLPILQGDSTPDRVRSALDASVRSGAARASLWRRGVVSNEVWSMIANYQAPSGPHCAEQLVDGCLIREATEVGVYLVQAGAKFPFLSSDAFNVMGLLDRDVQVMPAGVMENLPYAPPDGTLLREFGADVVYVVQGGAKFLAPTDEASPAEVQDIRIVPPNGTAFIPLIPPDFTRLREESAEEKYVVLNGARIQLDDAGEAALADMGFADAPVHVVPDGGLDQIPVLIVKRGDITCDGVVGIGDVLGLLRNVTAIPSPSPCIGVAGDVTCDGLAFTDDALLLLLYFAEAPVEPVVGCAPVGDPQPAILSQREAPASPAPPASE
jgi:hypothetical protein